MLKTTISNAYPKIPKDKREKNLRKAINRFEKGKISPEDLEDYYINAIEKAVNYQNEADLDLVTDGLIRWDDPFSRFSEGVKNLERGGLVRYFDNNTYYRKPVIKGELKFEKSVLVDDFKLASELSDAPVKAVLPSPYTFSMMLEDDYYFDQRRMIEPICEILAEEVRQLKDAGCLVVQFEEPVLLTNPAAVEWTSYWFNQIVSQFDLEFWLCFYFGEFSVIGEWVNAFKADCIAVDLVSHPDDFGAFCKIETDKKRCFGLIDSRDIEMEDEKELMKKLDRINDAVNGNNFYVSTSASLEFLPPKEAYEKLNLLGGLKKKFNEDEGDA